jgi:hypothetical protein
VAAKAQTHQTKSLAVELAEEQPGFAGGFVEE